MKSFKEQYNDMHKDACFHCEAFLEKDWNLCPYCGLKRNKRLATKLGGSQPDSVKQKISKSIKEFWIKRNAQKKG